MVFYNNDIHIDKYKLSEEVLFSKIDAEIVIVSPFSGSYFTLDSIGSRIWELLSKQPATVDELTT